MISYKKSIWVQLFIIYSRYLLGCTFVYASIVKILGQRFSQINGEHCPIDSAFHYFEVFYQSGLYCNFLGICQFIAGVLLMTQRYSKLGAIMSLPITANIFLITISFDFSYTWMVTGLMLLANILLIIWDWNELRILVNKPVMLNKNTNVIGSRVWEILGIVIMIFTVLYKMLYPIGNPIFWGGGCLIIGLSGMSVGLIKQSKRVGKHN